MNKSENVPQSSNLSCPPSPTLFSSLQFGAEFRRFSLDRSKPGRFDEFYGLLQHVHRIPNVELLVAYADVHGDLLPINNDDNYLRAVKSASPLLRLFLQRKGEDSSLEKRCWTLDQFTPVWGEEAALHPPPRYSSHSLIKGLFRDALEGLLAITLMFRLPGGLWRL